MENHFTEIDGLATVQQAIDLMRERAIQVLIVKKRSDEDEYGIVLLSDIAKKVLARDRAPERVNIYEVMTKPVVSVSPHMDVRYCARLFEQFGLSVVPVIEDEQVIGIVSYSELVLRGL
jgi:CBS domain-containing protein